jgi:hypothetical protein
MVAMLFSDVRGGIAPIDHGVAFGDMLAKATLTLLKLIAKLHCNPFRKS